MKTDERAHLEHLLRLARHSDFRGALELLKNHYGVSDRGLATRPLLRRLQRVAEETALGKDDLRGLGKVIYEDWLPEAEEQILLRVKQMILQELLDEAKQLMSIDDGEDRESDQTSAHLDRLPGRERPQDRRSGPPSWWKLTEDDRKTLRRDFNIDPDR